MEERTTFRWVITILGVLLIAVAILALGADAKLSFAEMEPRFTQIGEYWYQFHRDSYGGIQVFIERKLNFPFLWDPILLTMVQWPAWVLAAPLGIIMFVWGRA